MKNFYLHSPFVLQTAIWIPTRLIFRFFLHLEIRGVGNLRSLEDGTSRKSCESRKSGAGCKSGESCENCECGRHIQKYTNYIRPLDICVGGVGGFTEQLNNSTERRNKRGVIFAVSHGSELDPILVPASLSFLSSLMPIFYASRGQSFYKTSGWRQFFYGGLFFKLWGAHPVRAGTHNYEESLKPHIDLLERGKSICIFPEGRTMPEDAKGGEVHGGVAYLAYRTGAPIVPVRIKGVFKMTLREFLTRKRSVKIAFGSPIFPEELFPQNAQPSLVEIKVAASRILEAIQRL